MGSTAEETFMILWGKGMLKKERKKDVNSGKQDISWMTSRHYRAGT